MNKNKIIYLAVALLFILVVTIVYWQLNLQDNRVKSIDVNDPIVKLVANAKNGNREDAIRLFRLLTTQEVQNDKFDSEWVPLFSSLLTTRDTSLQYIGVLGLAKIRTPECKQPLLDFLTIWKREDISQTTELRAESDHFGAGMAAIMTLGEIGDESLIPFIESFRDVGFPVEMGGGPVEYALSRLGTKGLDQLTKNPPINENALLRIKNTISGIRSSDKIPWLISKVKNESANINIRFSALKSLGSMATRSVSQQNDAFNFLKDFIRETQYPKDLRGLAAEMIGKTGRKNAESILLDWLEQSNVCDIKDSCLLGLLDININKYLHRAFDIILDPNANEADREYLSGQLWAIINNKMELDKKPPITDGTLLKLIKEGLKAKNQYGYPFDMVRIYSWRMIYSLSGEEPQLVLSCPSKFDCHVCYIFEQEYKEKLRRQGKDTSITLDDIQEKINKRISQIVKRWEKFGE